MIRVSIEVSDDNSEERCEQIDNKSVDLERLGELIGRAIGGVWATIEFCDAQALIVGIQRYLPTELKSHCDKCCPEE